MEENDLRLPLTSPRLPHFDRTAAQRAERHGARVHAALRQVGAEFLAAVEAGAFARGPVALDEQRRREARVALQTVDVLRVDPTQHAAILQQREHEVAGSGVVLLVGVEHLASEDPEGRAQLVEVLDVEDRRRIAQVGDRELVQIPVETVRGAEVRDSRGWG